VALALGAVFADEPAHFLIVRDPPRVTDAALVLAGDPDYERTRSAARLVLSGQARLLILTGGEPGRDSAEPAPGGAGLGSARAIGWAGVSERTNRCSVQPIWAGGSGARRVTSPYQRRAAWAARRTFGV
jgi:hypothetical protein